eukprot:g12784.t1
MSCCPCHRVQSRAEFEEENVNNLHAEALEERNSQDFELEMPEKSDRPQSDSTMTSSQEGALQGALKSAMTPESSKSAMKEFKEEG